MVYNRGGSGKAMSMPGGLALGAMVSLAITLLASALIAKLVESEYMSWNHVGYGIMAMLFAGGYAGAAVSWRKIKRQKFPVCVISGVLYFGELLMITALFFGGKYQAVGVTAGMVMAGSLSAALIPDDRKRGGKLRKRQRIRG